jgi:hypothetical protein
MERKEIQAPSCERSWNAVQASAEPTEEPSTTIEARMVATASEAIFMM